MLPIEEWKQRTDRIDSRKWLSFFLTILILSISFLVGRQIAFWLVPAHQILTGMAFMLIYLIGNLLWIVYIESRLFPQFLKALIWGVFRGIFFLLLFPFRRKRAPIATAVKETLDRHELTWLEQTRQKTSLFWICGLGVGGGLGCWFGSQAQTPLISATLHFERLAFQFHADWMLDPDVNLFWCTLIFLFAGWCYGFVLHRLYRTGYMPISPIWMLLLELFMT